MRAIAAVFSRGALLAIAHALRLRVVEPAATEAIVSRQGRRA